jgi:hypothetical protein
LEPITRAELAQLLAKEVAELDAEARSRYEQFSRRAGCR